MVEEPLAARGITVSYETVRQWARKFGPEIRYPVAPTGAAPGRQVAPRRSGPDHRRPQIYLWRAVDQDGFVLDVLVQSRRDTRAAKGLARASF